MNKERKNKIVFIVFVSVFAFFWVASLLFLAFSVFSDNITNAIQSAYSKAFKEKTLNLFKVSFWSTLISTVLLVITLLFDEVKKKYLK